MIAKLVMCAMVALGAWAGSAGVARAEGMPLEAVEEGRRLELRAPARVFPNFRLEVGANVGVAAEERGWSGRDFIQGLPTNVSGDVRFVREMVLRGHGVWDAILERVEMDESERPWSTTSLVHVPMSVRPGGPKAGDLVPFVSFASEQHAVQADLMRFGAGGGAMIKIGRNAKVGMEAIYLGGSGEGGGDFGSELRVMGRLEWGF